MKNLESAELRDSALFTREDLKSLAKMIQDARHFRHPRVILNDFYGEITYQTRIEEKK